MNVHQKNFNCDDRLLQTQQRKPFTAISLHLSRSFFTFFSQILPSSLRLKQTSAPVEPEKCRQTSKKRDHFSAVIYFAQQPEKYLRFHRVAETDWNRARTSRGGRPRHRLLINIVRANRNKQLICVMINSPGCGKWQMAGGRGAWLPICSQAAGGSERRGSVSRREIEKKGV